METTEARRLAAADAAIKVVVRDRSDSAELRLQLLEAAAARLGGFDLESYQSRFEITPLERPTNLLDQARRVVRELDATGIHPALCLSALARETLDATSRRTKGAYHTDFRLAEHLAQATKSKLCPGIKIVDPACGAGILLTAVSVVACRSDRTLASDWLRHSVYAADLSPVALRGTLLALSALTDDLDSLQAMRRKWRTQDSLLAPEGVWASMAGDGFDVVVANPPWEKLKLTRHEFIKGRGGSRHYGSSYAGDTLAGYESAKSRKALHTADLISRYPSLRHGEPDLYVAFTELLLSLTRDGGSGALIVPGGLIRSKNTEALRRELIGSSQDLCFTVMANTAKHFAIDTRFKFLIVNYVKAACGKGNVRSIGVIHARADNDGVVAPRR
ncbi:MAG: N-6 DNA methylase, partial [Gammaproteobacteria bacterium]|nr:N-6 DNA methylase [Gammaproteobacteria bacterium]